MSTSGRPSSSSRTAPPTIHASSSPKTAWKRASSNAHHPLRPRPTRVETGGDLVSDGPGDPRVLLDPHTVAYERHRRPDRQLARQRYRERVHRDRPDHRPPLASHEHLGPRQIPPKAVCVADGHDADPRRLGRTEAP